MIAIVKSIPEFSLPKRSGAARRSWMERFGPGLGVAMGILCFLPYPALPIGNASSLQMGNIFCVLLLVPALALRWKHRPIFFLPILMAPLVISAIKVGATENGDLDLCFKAINVWAIALVTLFTAQIFIPKYGLQVLTGIAIVAILHALVGLIQLYSFSNGEFPFLGIYVNQSFWSIQENAEVIAKYIQRPFGLFPEPSAMACSLAPWLIFWAAEAGGIVRLRQTPARWQRVLFAVAAVGSLTLIILSGSGHTMITLAVLLLIGVLWFRKLRATPRTLTVILPIMAACIPLVILGAASVMSNRVESEVVNKSGSWDERSSSLIVGYRIWAHGDVPTILFGLGAGLSSPGVWDAARLDAVFSVSLSYLYETGLVGVAAVCFLGAYLLRVWRASELNPAFAAILVVWLVGVTLTTSYAQLIPIWIALAWLSVWPAVCTTPAPEPVIHGRLLDVPLPDPNRRLRKTAWNAPADSSDNVRN